MGNSHRKPGQRPPALKFREFVETYFDGVFSESARVAYHRYMDARIAGLLILLPKYLQPLTGVHRMPLEPAYLEFLASHSLEDSDESRAQFLQYMESSSYFSLLEPEERIPTTNEDFESLNRHAQWAQEQEWIRYRPWMASVFKMQSGIPNPSGADIEANMDRLWLRLLGITGGTN